MWIKINGRDDLPKKPGLKHYEQIECLIFHKGDVKFRVWNCEHECWDDDEGDDYFCDALAPSHYMIIPDAPKEP